MKKLITGALLTATLMANIQSAQAAWVVGFAASEQVHQTEFVQKVEAIAFTTAVTAFFAGLFIDPTGTTFGMIFLLNDENAEANIKNDLLERYPDLRDSEIIADLVQLTMNAKNEGITMGTETTDEVEVTKYKIVLDRKDVFDLYDFHGISLDNPSAKKLLMELTTDLK